VTLYNQRRTGALVIDTVNHIEHTHHNQPIIGKESDSLDQDSIPALQHLVINVPMPQWSGRRREDCSTNVIIASPSKANYANWRPRSPPIQRTHTPHVRHVTIVADSEPTCAAAGVHTKLRYYPVAHYA
jgi:hypothetical protein